MFQSEHQLSLPTNVLSIQDSTALVIADQKETLVPKEELQNGGFSQAEFVMHSSKKLQDDLQSLGLEIKQHEDSLQLMKSQKNKLDDSILDLQVTLGKYHSSSAPLTENKGLSNHQSEQETVEQILRHEKSAAGILCQLKIRHGTQVSHLPWTKDVVGIVATLGKVEDDNLNRLLSEYLGVQTMLAIVCKTYEGVKAMELYDKECCINKISGLHGLGASIGRALDGRFLVICLENLSSYAGDFVAGDPQRKLDLLKPKLPNGECPPGFLGFAVNMIDMDSENLLCVTASGNGLRETLLYSLFSQLQVYRTRADMVRALPCIRNGALSLDGGMIRSNGVFFLGNREEVDVRFLKSSVASTLPEDYRETENKMKELKWKREKLLEDIQRERQLLDRVKFNFARMKQDFVRFLAESSSYMTQHQM